MGGARGEAAQPVHKADPPLQGSAHKREEQVVDVHLLVREPRLPPPIQLGRERVRKGPVEVEVDRTTQHVVVECEARCTHGTEHGGPQLGAIVELVGVGCLEEQAA